MGKTPEHSLESGSDEEARRRLISWLSLYAVVALLLMATAVGLQFEPGSYAVLLLVLLGLVIRHVELHQRERRSAGELSRLNSDLRRALAESQALGEVSKEISGQVQLGPLLDLVSRRAREMLGADSAGVALLGAETGGIGWIRVVGFRWQALQGVLRQPGEGIAGRVVATGRLVVVEDLDEDSVLPREEAPLHRAEGIVALLAVPLVRGGRTLGALAVGYRRRRTFSEREIGLVDALAAQASVAIENARLYDAERRRAAELAAVVEHMSDGVVITDRHGRIVRCNEAAARLLGENPTGETLRALSGRGVLSFEGPGREALPLEEWPVARASRGEQFSGRETTLRRADGSLRNLTVDASPVVDEEGEVVLGVTVVHDVTAGREMEQLKDEFLSLAAHELKTPLTSLKGYAQILLRLEAGELGTRQRRALEVINQQVDRINRMVEQFLQVADIRFGRFALKPERVDLSDLAAAACDGVQRVANGCEIHCQLSGPVPVVADPRSLELVMSNLLRNAIKYSPPGGRVELTVVAVGPEALVSVRDRGLGIPKEKQAHVFDRFYQVQPGTDSERGVGLGLYISQQLVEIQGGRMWLESEEGQGSSFYCALPLAE